MIIPSEKAEEAEVREAEDDRLTPAPSTGPEGPGEDLIVPETTWRC
jgi:hypothetical protein